MKRKLGQNALSAIGAVGHQGNLWTQTLPRLVLTPALALSLLTLTGCNNSPSGHADEAALQASNKAARIVASAGAFRPQQNFPGKLSTPLKSQARLDQYIAAHVGSARTHPAPFLMPRSKSRDLRHAASLISTALASPDIHYQFKGLLEAQQGMISLDNSQRSLVRLSAALDGIRSAVDGVNQLALKIAGHSGTLQSLETGAKMMEQLTTALASAKTERAAAAAALTAATNKSATLSAQIKTLQSRRTSLDGHGLQLQNQSQQTTGTVSLASFKQSVALLNQGGALGQKIEILQGHLDFATADLAAARLKLEAATAKVEQLSATLTTARELDQKQAARAANIKAGITALITSSNPHLFTLNRRIATLTTQWKTMERNSAAAVTAARQAQQQMQTAAVEQSKSSSESQQLQTAGMQSFNPLVEAISNHTPQCLLDIYQGLAGLYSAEAYQLHLTAITSRLQAQTDAAKAYATVGMTSPLPALDTAVITTLKTNAQKALLGALSSLEQARAAYPSGTSPVQWLTPAVETMVYLQLAQVAPNGLQANQALAKAAQVAAEAHKYNPFLILPKIAAGE